MVAIHVDDLKMAGPVGLIQKIASRLERTFGKLVVQWHNFTNCGVRRQQDAKTFEVTLDQFQYADALKKIVIPGNRAAGSSEVVTAPIFGQFPSLTGAAAHTHTHC